MNRDFAIKNTGNYDEWLIEQLKDPEEALSYLEAALEEYREDNDFTALRYAALNFFRAQYSLLKPKNLTGIDISIIEQSRNFTPYPKLINLSQDLSYSDALIGNLGLSKNEEPTVKYLDRIPSKALVDVGITYE